MKTNSHRFQFKAVIPPFLLLAPFAQLAEHRPLNPRVRVRPPHGAPILMSTLTVKSSKFRIECAYLLSGDQLQMWAPIAVQTKK